MSACYTCQARFHNSPDAPLITKRWYFTDQDFDNHPSLQGSNHWSDLRERNVLVGEQWFDPPWPEKERTVDGLLGDHECGDESDFEEGQPWPYTGPPIEYDEDHIPLCCPRIRPPIVAAGGIPSADTRYTPPPAGPDCCSAPPLESGRTYVVDQSLPVGGFLWFRYLAGPGEYTFTLTFDTPYDFSSTLDCTSGPACDDQDRFQFLMNYTATSPVTISADSTICLIYTDNSGSRFRFSFLLTPVIAPGGRPTAGGFPSATYSYLPPGHHTDATSGGGRGGGRVGDVPSGSDATAGGGRGGGSAGDVSSGIDATAGGGVGGGSVGEEPGGNDPTSGGGVGGGRAGDIPSGTDATAGGGRGGGSAGDVPSGTDATAGGGAGGGSAGDIESAIDATAGGGVGGGSGGDTWAPTAASVRAVSQGDATSGYTLPTRVSGDILVCFVAPASTLLSPSTGWTFRTVVNSSPTGLRLQCFTRTSNGTDNAPTANTASQYVIYSVKNATTVATVTSKASTSAGSTISTNTLTTSKGGITLNAWGGAGAFGTQTPPAGWTTTSQTAAPPNVATGYLAQLPGTYGTVDYDVGASMGWASITVSVQ